MLQTLLAYIQHQWDVVIGAFFILMGSIIHTAAQYRKHRQKGESRPSLYDMLWIWGSAIFAGLIVSQAVLAWTDSGTWAGVGGAIGAVMGIEYIERLAQTVLRFLDRRGNPRD